MSPFLWNPDCKVAHASDESACALGSWTQPVSCPTGLSWDIRKPVASNSEWPPPVQERGLSPTSCAPAEVSSGSLLHGLCPGVFSFLGGNVTGDGATVVTLWVMRVLR